MTSTHAHATAGAFLIQALANRAQQLHGADALTVRLDSEDGGPSISFTSLRPGQQPPSVPAQCQPTRFDGMKQEILPGDPPTVRWSWRPDTPFIHDWIAGYAAELLRFFPGPVTFEHHTSGFRQNSGGHNPLTHLAADPPVSEALDEHLTLVLVLPHDQPNTLWTRPNGDYPGGTARPNIVFADGMTRIDRQLYTATTRRRNTVRLAPGRHRAPAHLSNIEFRIVSGKPNRRALASPHTPGIPAEVTHAALAAARRLDERWLQNLAERGISCDAQRDTDLPRVHQMVRAEPYGPPVDAAVALPATIKSLTAAPNVALATAHAICAQRPETVVWHHDAATAFTLLELTGVTASDPPAEIRFDAMRERPEDDHDGHNHPLVRPMRSMTARLRLERPGREPEQIELDIPALMTKDHAQRDPAHFQKLYITLEGRATLTEQQVRQLAKDAQAGSLADSIANAAVHDRTEAFRKELAQLLQHWKPPTGLPDREVTAVFGPHGLRIETAGQPPYP